MVRAKMAVLQHDFKVAENILVDQGQIDECLDMYQELHKWDEAIFVAEAKNHENAADLRSNYYTWLIDTGQEGQAAVLKEKEGDLQLAVQLYLKGGLAGRAAARLGGAAAPQCRRSAANARRSNVKTRSSAAQSTLRTTMSSSSVSFGGWTCSARASTG